jgi:hypothetical protein
MRKFLGCSTLLLALLALQPSDVLGQKKDKKAKDQTDRATPQDYAHLQNVKELKGTVDTIDANSKIVGIRLDIPEYVENPGYKANPNNNINTQYQRDLQRLYRDQQMAMQTRNPIQRQQRMHQIAQDMQRIQNLAYKGQGNNGPYKMVTHSKTFELELEENVATRKMFLGTEYDDQGNIKTYTKAELDKLRGTDSSKPGYKAKLEDVQPGQEVTLYLKAPKKKSSDSSKSDEKADAEKKDAEKKDAKKADADISSVDHPTVRMIVMTKEMNSSLAGTDAKKNKK